MEKDETKSVDSVLGPHTKPSNGKFKQRVRNMNVMRSVLIIGDFNWPCIVFGGYRSEERSALGISTCRAIRR